MRDWMYYTSVDGFWDDFCWWIAERVPPRFARCVFTRVHASVGDPQADFRTIWNYWTVRHQLERNPDEVPTRHHAA